MYQLALDSVEHPDWSDADESRELKSLTSVVDLMVGSRARMYRLRALSMPVPAI